MSISKKMNIYFGACSLIPFLAMAAVAYCTVSKPLKNQAIHQLMSIRDTQIDRIENYFSTLRQQIQTSSDHQLVVAAAKHYKGVFSDFRMKENVSDSEFDDHSIINDFLEPFGCDDIFIADPETGDIVYSARNKLDFATSLKDNPFADTNLGKVFSEASKSNDPNFVKMVDFGSCTLLCEDVACFMASPIFDGTEKVGILIFQISNDEIHRMMSKKQDWKSLGMGKSGETYIIGDDFKIRSQPRLFVENKAEYFKQMSALGANPAVLETIRATDSAMLLQSIKTKGAQAAISGKTEVEIFPDYRNVTVLSAYAPLHIEDIQWFLMTEIDEKEGFSSLYSLRDRLLISGGAIAAIALLCVALLTSRITGALREVVADLSKIARTN